MKLIVPPLTKGRNGGFAFPLLSQTPVLLLFPKLQFEKIKNSKIYYKELRILIH